LPTLTLGFSPCPNDTFMFGALVNGLVDSGAWTFEPVIEDVESLNRRALAGELDVTKLSAAAYAFAERHYVLLDSGSALGKNCGPLIVSKNAVAGDLAGLRLAIPGKYTTANLLATLFYPAATDKTEMVFSAIEDAVASGAFDAGVVIHESRFTYAGKGLRAVADLGTLWEQKTGQYLPLGFIAARRAPGTEQAAALSALIAKSIRHAMDDPASVMPFVRKHADTMDEGVMRQHIALYVNEFSLALTVRAKEAIRLLLDAGSRQDLLPRLANPLFPG